MNFNRHHWIRGVFKHLLVDQWIHIKNPRLLLNLARLIIANTLLLLAWVLSFSESVYNFSNWFLRLYDKMPTILVQAGEIPALLLFSFIGFALGHVLRLIRKHWRSQFSNVNMVFVFTRESLRSSSLLRSVKDLMMSLGLRGIVSKVLGNALTHCQVLSCVPLIEIRRSHNITTLISIIVN